MEEFENCNKCRWVAGGYCSLNGMHIVLGSDEAAIAAKECPLLNLPKKGAAPPVSFREFRELGEEILEERRKKKKIEG